MKMKMNMKTKLIIIMILSTLLALDAASRTTASRMVVISDTHLLSPELVTPGTAINQADAGDTKMMAMSDDIMGAITDSIIDLKPMLVLLTGDLTHNGERASHERMVHYLDRMAAHGIQSLVIPGHHPPPPSPGASLPSSTPTMATERPRSATPPR